MMRVGLMWMAMVLMITSQAAGTQGMPSYRAGSMRTRLGRRLLNDNWGSDGEGDSFRRVSEPGAPPQSSDWNNNESSEQQGNPSTSQSHENGQEWKSTSGNNGTSGNTQNNRQQQQQQQQNLQHQPQQSQQQQQQQQQQQNQQGSNGSQRIPGTIPYPGYEFLERAFGQAGIRIVPRTGAALESGQPCNPAYFGQVLPGVKSVCVESSTTPAQQGNQGR